MNARSAWQTGSTSLFFNVDDRPEGGHQSKIADLTVLSSFNW